MLTRRRAAGFSFYPRAQLASTDHDVIMRFQEAVGLGKIRGPYDRTGRKAFVEADLFLDHEWGRGVRRAGQHVWDLMCERRRDQIRDVRMEDQ